ncbi:MAG: 2,3-bisphosphoglycerate-independent phosphoglycerate mutase [Tenuifilaceae bacterium]|jgi:2,3-bisphosphoglycerate-independent phosphoglycerate mutase|nr:2,3-bisphosphoglycerate-independent phosphoglycerate mutase [Bacteroidales bacterium]MDI9516056.1 2,3-bisphosphoglycerate-independent phosphoglycerate mutase [Bacteroidota bacterium]OQC62276.1 MAG: 2,3-bisphosphoglycerate-independent phosphoglycerate mutase [Bacteroidetes bacterium ADurb.Bin008]HNV81658.1 2,3-bisphosphoglycerate-independent phosphoglycerate mutase [Tenuifilaceae bacterium]MZP81554.1 2,3-bisphosphoglycerate-independent phosphoglycerate mutase [Bacteroidales bacterium]
MTNNSKVLLMILDGWGIGKGDRSDAIATTQPKNMTDLKNSYPNAQLLTCGEDVGLPAGQMGNSEVGHLNIGAGRVVYQDLVRINMEIRDGKIESNPVLTKAFTYAREKDVAVHFIGLVSDGGVHSMDTHLYKLCDMTKGYGLEKVYIHALTDGRDTDPQSGLGFVRNLEEHLQHSNGVIASLTGRYYTMDRDKRWERIKVGYDLMVSGIGKPTQNITKAMEESYAEGITDEFIKPIVRVDDGGQPVGLIRKGDVVICFNFRTDRLREITIALTQKDMPEHGMHTIPLHYVTMTRYDDTFKGVHVAYEKDNLKNTLGEVVSKAGLKQLRIAETEKYAHVTFFFSGGREAEFKGESRILIPSPKVATYDLKPEMSAFEVKAAIVDELNHRTHDFICLNFANGDMVGHTGVYSAIQTAVKAVDQCVGEVVTAARNNGYTVIIIADHGNADNAINADGSPNTAHSLNPVPIILVSDKCERVENGILADVAPTILSIMGLPIPEEMTGKVLCR